MGTLRKYQKETLKIKNTVTYMKNAFDRLLTGLDTAKETISEPEDRSIEASQTDIQKGGGREEGRETNRIEHLRTWAQY